MAHLFLTRVGLSAATSGRGVTVTGTTATGTLIHTAVSGTSKWDEVYLWAVNTASIGKKLTVEWARSTGAAGQTVEFTVPGEDGPYLVVPGWSLRNSRQVRAFAACGNKIILFGHANRLSTA